MESSRAQKVRSWKAALIGGLTAFALAYGICVGLVAWGQEVFPSADPRAPRLFKQFLPAAEGGGATFYAFQRIPVNIATRESTTERVNSRFEEPENGDARAVVSPLGGLLFVGVALIVGGAVAWRRQIDQSVKIRGSAVRMAIVFAVATFGLRFVLPLETVLEPQSLSRRSTMVTYTPSHLGAIVWPLVWALVFGSLGMHIAQHGRDWRRQLFSRIASRSTDAANALRSALSGLAVGCALVVAAGVATAGVAIAQHPAGAGNVLGSAKNVAGIAEGVILGLPHATAAGLFGSMGVPARFQAGEVDGSSGAKGSAGIFGVESRKPFGSFATTVPRYALGGLGIAAIFTMVTGFRAAGSAGGDRRRAIRTALMAAAMCTVLLWIIAYLVSARGSFALGIAEPRQEMRASVTASPLALIILPIAWTIGGGLVGAVLRLPEERRAAEQEGLSPLPGSRRSFATRSLVGGAVMTLVAVGAGVVISDRIVDPTPSVSTGPAGLNVYRDPTNAWTVQFPDTWHVHPISESTRGGRTRFAAHGVLLANIDHRFQQRAEREDTWSPGFDMQGVPPTIVAVQVLYNYTGGFTVTCPDTPTPLSLDKAHQMTTNDGVGGTELLQLSLPFVAQNLPYYSVSAWIGQSASPAEKAALDRIVASISFEDAQPGPPIENDTSLCR